jgi:hypothetical protein
MALEERSTIRLVVATINEIRDVGALRCVDMRTLQLTYHVILLMTRINM